MRQKRQAGYRGSGRKNFGRGHWPPDSFGGEVTAEEKLVKVSIPQGLENSCTARPTVHAR